MTPPTRLRLETLESRRTPATLAADGRTVTFQDADGDTASVAFSASVLNPVNVGSVFHFDIGFLPGDNSAPQQLQTIDLTGLPANLSVTVKATTVVGDGKVDVGWVNATGKDVGIVNVSGDLGRMTAGDAITRTPGLRALMVGSIGVRNLATQEPGGSLASVVSGALGSLTVGGDVHGASVSAAGGSDGKIGRVRIGGDLAADPAIAASGLIQAFGAMGPVLIGGNVVGGDQPNSGLRAGGTLGPVTILGNVQGGTGPDSASIIGNLGVQGLTVGTAAASKSVIGAGPTSASVWALDGNIGPVKIYGDLLGGPGIGSAAIRAINVSGKGGRIGPVTITGDVTGMATDSAAIRADVGIGPVHLGGLTGGSTGSGTVVSQGPIGPVKVDGDVTGGVGDYSGFIRGTSIRSVTFGGSLAGSTATFGGAVLADKGNLGPVRISGNVTGGGGDYSGSVQAYGTYVGPKLVGGQIAAVTITGDVTGGAGKYSGAVYAQDRIGRVMIGTPTGIGSLTGGGGQSSASITAAGAGIAAVTIYGDVTGGVGDFSAMIDTNGKLGPVAVKANGRPNLGDVTGGVGKQSASIHGLTIAKVTVNGSVAGGSGVNGASILADQSIGLVTVNGAWTGASIAAGVDPGADGYFGTGDDTRTFAGTIAGITIGGAVDGTPDGVSATDHFAFTAGWIMSLKVNAAAVALTSGKWNDTTPMPLGTTGDFGVVELP